MTAQIQWACAVCERKLGQSTITSLPEGWREVWGALICPNHRIVAELRLIQPDTDESGAIVERTWRRKFDL